MGERKGIQLAAQEEGAHGVGELSAGLGSWHPVDAGPAVLTW